MTWLLTQIPPPAFALMISLIGLGLVLGIFSRKRAFSLLGLVLLGATLVPFIPSLRASLPLWVLIPLFVWGALRLVRHLAEFFLGREAAGEMIGSLAADVVKYFFRRFVRILSVPFRLFHP